ncbi:hypothetical protein KSF73_14140 [Burkholderiaceae bacterium DAT-1]|nr:hypothetical protein [Burkholderiaceae bacterium DAT-1]
MKNPHYRTPKVLKHWLNDVPGGELYELLVLDNGTVCSACGRYAHSSGSTTCTWREFLEGEMNDLAAGTVGQLALAEALTFVSIQIRTSARKWWQI